MDFGWNELEAELHQRTLAFSRGPLASALADSGKNSAALIRGWRLLGDHGLFATPIPEALGGLGLGAMATARAFEALGQGAGDTGFAFSAAAHLFACVMPMVEHGSPALCDALIPPLIDGRAIGANAITEAAAGSDVFALKTRAVLDGDSYVVTGEKSFVTNAPIADLFLVYASTDPSAGYMGITAFAIDRDCPGLTIGKPFSKMGLETSPIATVYLEDCRVPRRRVVGEPGTGARVFTRSMLWERSCLFAAYLGAMEHQLEATIAHAKARVQFRKPIARHQAIAHRIADMKVRLEAARLLLYRACWLRDRGDDASLEVSMAKLAVSEAAIQSGLDAIHIHGGSGFIVDTGIERALRDAIPATIFSGTSEIQRDIIARELGL